MAEVRGRMCGGVWNVKCEVWMSVGSEGEVEWREDGEEKTASCEDPFYSVLTDPDQRRPRHEHMV